MKAVLLLIALTGVAHAEQRKSVTLADALAAAAKAPQSAAPVAEIAVADATAQAAGAWPSPSLRVATTRLTARVVAGAALPLPVFGTVGAARRHAAAEATVVRAQAGVELRELRSRVVHAWIELARADGVLVASSIAAQHAAELEVIARGRKDAGVGADVDITVAQAAKGRAEVDAIAAERGLEAASAELAGLLGWDPAQPLHADGGLFIGDAAALDTLRAKLLTHPAHVLAQGRVVAAETNLREVRAERWPAVALEAELQYDDRSMTEGRTAWARTDAVVGISIELPIFARVGDRARAARAQQTVARMRLAVTDAELGAGLFATYRRWQAATEKLQALERDVVPAQERAAALSAQAFREGVRDLSSAVQAQRDLAVVQAEVNGARADAAAAFADLQLAAGEEVGRAR
ncbi:MAG TPA: TolC family protein [Kofleriaceae bacterium]